MKDKVASIIGFAVKARKAVTGIDAAERCRKRIYLFILCSTAADNTKKNLIKLAKERKADIIISSPAPLGDFTGNPSIKILGITDGQMAKAMKKYLGGNFHIYTEVE